MASRVESRRHNPDAISGVVLFPSTNPDYTIRTSAEGCYVQLVVVEKRSEVENWWDDSFLVCWGGSNTTLDYQETLAGTDTLLDEAVPYSAVVESPEQWDKLKTEKAHATNILFPHLFDHSIEKNHRSQSVPVLAVVTLGSCGAAWVKTGTDAFWCCTLEDLDLQGRLIYEQMQNLYSSKAELHLITWIDEG